MLTTQGHHLVALSCPPPFNIRVLVSIDVEEGEHHAHTVWEFGMFHRPGGQPVGVAGHGIRGKMRIG